jgi:hypothetical protein
MTKDEVRKLEALFIKHLEPNFKKNRIPLKVRREIKSASKDMAFEFKEQEVNRLFGDSRSVFEVDSSDTLKYHSVKMLELMGVSPHDVFGATRGTDDVTIARQICIYMLRKKYGQLTASDKVLAQTFGRHRTSIIHNLNTIVSLLNINDPSALSYYSCVKDYKFKNNETIPNEPENKTA